jgi:hypothetical protein
MVNAKAGASPWIETKDLLQMWSGLIQQCDTASQERPCAILRARGHLAALAWVFQKEYRRPS